MTFPQSEPEEKQLTPVTSEQVGSATCWVRMRLSTVDSPDDWASALATLGVPGPEAEQESEQGGAESADEVRRQVREQLESIIDLIQSQASLNVRAVEARPPVISTEDLRSVDELVADPQRFDELIQRIVNEGASEDNSEHIVAETELAHTAIEPTDADLPFEGILTTVEGKADTAVGGSSWDMSLDVPAFLAGRSEVTVYEIADDRLQLYILCEQGEPGTEVELRTVHANQQGELLTGVPLDAFIEELVESFPAQEVQWVLDGSSFLHEATFFDGLDQLTLDPAGRCAALVELPMSDLPVYMRPEIIAGEVQAAPADKGWSLLHADSLTLGRLLQAMNVAAIVAEKTFFAQNLSFVVPSGGGQKPVEGAAVSEWVSRALGTPDTAHAGAVLTFGWSPSAKCGAVSPPFESPAGDMLWSLPGRLPDAYQDIVSGDNLDQLIWLYGLEGQAARRLTNYVMDGASAEGLESALHALELPEELLKVVEGSVLLTDFVGYKEFGPQMSGLGRLKESVTAYPNGTDALSAVSRELIRRPWLATADSLVQLGASGALALWATRRLAQGQSARGAAVAAAALGASGATELVIARAYRKLHQKQADLHEPIEAPHLSLIDELQAQTQQTELENEPLAEPDGQPGVAVVGTARKWGAKVISDTKKRARRYFQ